MASAGGSQGNQQEGQRDQARKLIRMSHLWEALTLVAVILVSPASLVLGLPFGISPSDWLASWTHWTVVFITVAFLVSLAGFEAALADKVRAGRAKSLPT